MGRFDRRWTAFLAGLVLLVALVQIRRESTRERSWPVPSRGYNQDRIDYAAPRFPQATIVNVATVEVPETARPPMAIDVPNKSASHPLVFEGIIQHHLPVEGGYLKIRFTAPPESPQARFNTEFDLVTLTGQGGRLPFRSEGRVPAGKGSFDVEIEVEALKITDGKPGLAATVVAKGTILVE